ADPARLRNHRLRRLHRRPRPLRREPALRRELEVSTMPTCSMPRNPQPAPPPAPTALPKFLRIALNPPQRAAIRISHCARADREAPQNPWIDQIDLLKRRVRAQSCPTLVFGRPEPN